MSADLSRWAVVAYNDDTGLGRMAQDARAVLGVRQLVVPSARLATKPLAPGRDVLLRKEAGDQEIEAALLGLEGLLLLERPDWHPRLLPVAKRLGLRTACVPMWEWIRVQAPEWTEIDAILCPSEFCLRIVRDCGWSHARVLDWSLDLERFPKREIRGPGRTFFHNAGLVDDDDRKGTRDTIRAFRRLARTDVRLIVRMQKAAELPELDERIEVRIGNLGEPAELYAEGEVAVQPSKMEGLGFMVLEPVCVGVPTVTIDYPPMSDCVAQPQLRARLRWFKRSAFPARAAGVKHAHLRLPDERDLMRRMAWCAEHDLAEVSRANRAFAEARYEGGRLRSVWSRALGELG